MIYLLPFTQAQAGTICSWIHDEQELVLFSGPVLFRHPLTEDQFPAYLGDPGRKVYAAFDNYTDALIGMGELTFSSENTVRLCRILVGNEFRGRGYGQLLTQALTQDAFANPGIQRVELNVYDANTAAIRCYQQCGFTIDETGQDSPGDPNGRRGIRMYIRRGE